jgi:diguanylate cyclase (GGDEF)-like protein
MPVRWTLFVGSCTISARAWSNLRRNQNFFGIVRRAVPPARKHSRWFTIEPTLASPEPRCAVLQDPPGRTDGELTPRLGQLMNLLTRLYVGSVIVVGCSVALLAGVAMADFDTKNATFLVLAGLAIVGELFPFQVPFRHEAQEITLSTPFVLAILVTFGVPEAITVQLIGSVLADCCGRKVWWKTAFDAGQYSIAWAVAGGAAVLANGAALGVQHGLTLGAAVEIALVGTTFFVVNHTLVAVAIAIAAGAPLLSCVRRDLGFHVSTALVLTSLSPIVIVLGNNAPGFVPLLLLPIAAVHRSAQISIDKDHQAHHDALTLLPNRTAFREWVEQTVAAQPTAPLAVVIIDLDSFKEVNDTLGHQMGDRLLRCVAERLDQRFAPEAFVARLGGDEFALAAGPGAAGDCMALGRMVGEALSAPIPLNGLLLPATASIGAARYPEDGENVDTLLQRADIAMYLAKERGTGFETYRADRDHHTTRRLALLGELHDAIEQSALVFHYQPVADIATGRMISTEALIRWQHPEHGLIPPDEFIPLAEPTGLIEPLTTYALEHALHQCRRWLDEGRDVGVAVNVSVRNLYEDAFANKVKRLLALTRVPARFLTIEITEGTVMADPARVATVLDELHAMGVRIAIDDFGTGYSSLVHLKRLPVDYIKIDRSFVMNMDANDDDAAIVRSTIDLAHNLGLQVVAEGVETEAHWEKLAQLGCDHGQGYFIARPVPPDRLDLTRTIPVGRTSESPGRGRSFKRAAASRRVS